MKNGFTVVELLVVIGIALILAAAAIPIYGNLQVSAQLNENSAQIVQTIRTAKERSEAGYNNARHGVYFDINTSDDDSYVLYQGSSYATRDSAYDRVIALDSALILSNSSFALTGDDIDINFSRGKGKPKNTGTMILSHSVEGLRLISVNSQGMVEEE